MKPPETRSGGSVEKVVIGDATPSRPLLRYHGGKWELADWIIEHLPAHHMYVEPYGGAASVLLQKPRSYGEVYNDLDGDIVHLFRMIRERPDELDAAVRATPFSRDEYMAAFVPSDEPIERARRVLIRSHMGHAGAATHGRCTGFRSRSINSGSHPSNQWRCFPDHMTAIVERWRGVVIENRPALDVIAMHDDEKSLFYLDPPYVLASRDGGKDYRHEMTDDQHRELAMAARGVRGMVVVSGYPSELYDELYAGWRRVERDAMAEGAGKRIEVLWLNDAAWSALQGKQHHLFAKEPA